MFLRISPSRAWIPVVAGLVAAMFSGPSTVTAGDHFFHKGQLIAVPAAAAPVQQVAVAAPAQMATFQTVQMAPVQMSYVPVAVQAAPVQQMTYTLTMPSQPQAPAAPQAQAAPVINIRLETPAPVAPAAAPQAPASPQASAQQTQIPVASLAPQSQNPVAVTPNTQGQAQGQFQVQAQAATMTAASAGTVMVPQGAIPMQLYYVPKTHGHALKFRSIRVLGVR
jgi:hypothetical protein